MTDTKKAAVISELLDHCRLTLANREKFPGWSELNRKKWRGRVEALQEILDELTEESDGRQREETEKSVAQEG